MRKIQKDEFITNFAKQIQIINEIYLELSCDLYICFEGETEIENLQKKLDKLKQIKNNLIRLNSTLIAEF